MQKEGQMRGGATVPDRRKGVSVWGKTTGCSSISSGLVAPVSARMLWAAPAVTAVGNAPRAAALHVLRGQGTRRGLQSARLLIQTRLPRLQGGSLS